MDPNIRSILTPSKQSSEKKGKFPTKISARDNNSSLLPVYPTIQAETEAVALVR